MDMDIFIPHGEMILLLDNEFIHLEKHYNIVSYAKMLSLFTHP